MRVVGLHRPTPEQVVDKLLEASGVAGTRGAKAVIGVMVCRDGEIVTFWDGGCLELLGLLAIVQRELLEASE